MEESLEEQEIHEVVTAQQVYYLFENTPSGLFGAVLCAASLVALNWNVIPRPVLLGWLVAYLVISLVRYGLVSFTGATEEIHPNGCTGTA